MLNIEEKLDKLTDLIFGVSQYPSYYKEYQGYFGQNHHIHVHEPNCIPPITRYNGQIEKEIFYENLKRLREKVRSRSLDQKKDDDLEYYLMAE